MGETTKIIDEYTNLPISRQRKYALRHPDKVKLYRKNYEKNEEYKRKKSIRNAEYRNKKRIDNTTNV